LAQLVPENEVVKCSGANPSISVLKREITKHKCAIEGNKPRTTESNTLMVPFRISLLMMENIHLNEY
jgi:hypothetical protein